MRTGSLKKVLFCFLNSWILTKWDSQKSSINIGNLYLIVEPEKQLKILLDMLKADNKAKGIEEIGEGSTCFEHCFEFWGTLKVKKEGIPVVFLKNS
jgi:hypothetical protein